MSQPIKFLFYEAVLVHGMSIGQLKLAVLNDLAMKEVIDDIPLNRSVFSVLFVFVS